MNVQDKINQDLRHNYFVTFLDGTFFWLGNSFFAERTILPLFISQLTDSTLAIGILSALVATGTMLPQLFTANWVQRSPVKKMFPVNIGFFTERLPIIALVLAAWMVTWSKPAALIFTLVCFGWFKLGIGVVAVGWQDMVAKLFPMRTRGRFFGTTFFVGTVAGILGASGAAWVLDNYPFPTNYMISFGLGAVFMMISWGFLALTKEPADPPKIIPPKKSVDWKKIREVLKEDTNFRRYILASIIGAMGTMAVGFLTIFTLNQWQLPISLIGLFTTFFLCGQAVGSLGFGWLADRYGHKLVLEIINLLSAFSLVIALLAKSPQVFYLVFALQGAYGAAAMLSGINIVFEFCTPDVRPTYIGLANTAIGIFTGLAPLIGGLIIDQFNYTALFTTAMVFSLAAYFALRFGVAEPRLSHQST
ncbi:MAG: MFS transporter [Chloroflexota bacterium]